MSGTFVTRFIILGKDEPDSNIAGVNGENNREV